MTEMIVLMIQYSLVEKMINLLINILSLLFHIRDDSNRDPVFTSAMLCFYEDDMEEYWRLCRWKDNIKMDREETSINAMNRVS